MLDQTALSRRSLFAALGLGVLVVLAVIVLGRTAPISAQGPFTISKAADVINTYPGDRVTYTITFTNTGTAGVATMTDVIPFGVTYVGGSATGGATYSSGRVTWSGTVNSGQTVVVTFQVDVVEPSTLGPFPIPNEARLCSGGSCVWSNTVIIYSSRVRFVYLPIVTRNHEFRTPWPWIQPGGRR